MSPPLRIVQVVPSLVVGGAERFATWLAEAQRAAGHDVHVVCVSAGGPLLGRLPPELAERTRIVGKHGRYDAGALPRLHAELSHLAPDVVHTHLFTALAWGAVAARAARVPVVIHTHHEVHDDDQRYLPAVRRALAPLLDVIVGCSAAALADVRRRAYDLGTRSALVDNGLPLRGRPTSTLDGRRLRLVAVGRMVPIKGHLHLLEALARVRARGIDAELLLLGDGPLHDALARQARDLGLADHVHLPGAVDDVDERLASADLFVQPSLSEAMPMALLEAAGAGLPLLVTDVGGAPTLLRAGAGGWAVPPADPDALAEAIVRYAALPASARRTLGAASRATVIDRFDIGRCAAAYEALYRDALARRR